MKTRENLKQTHIILTLGASTYILTSVYTLIHLNHSTPVILFTQEVQQRYGSAFTQASSGL